MAKIRNLVQFCVRPTCESRNHVFNAAYAFRDNRSQFSVMKNDMALPEPKW